MLLYIIFQSDTTPLTGNYISINKILDTLFCWIYFPSTSSFRPLPKWKQSSNERNQEVLVAFLNKNYCSSSLISFLKIMKIVSCFKLFKLAVSNSSKLFPRPFVSIHVCLKPDIQPHPVENLSPIDHSQIVIYDLDSLFSYATTHHYCWYLMFYSLYAFFTFLHSYFIYYFLIDRRNKLSEATTMQQSNKLSFKRIEFVIKLCVNIRKRDG